MQKNINLNDSFSIRDHNYVTWLLTHFSQIKTQFTILGWTEHEKKTLLLQNTNTGKYFCEHKGHQMIRHPLLSTLISILPFFILMSELNSFYTVQFPCGRWEPLLWWSWLWWYAASSAFSKSVLGKRKSQRKWGRERQAVAERKRKVKERLETRWVMFSIILPGPDLHDDYPVMDWCLLSFRRVRWRRKGRKRRKNKRSWVSWSSRWTTTSQMPR